MSEAVELLPGMLAQHIHFVCGYKVMLDADLALPYNVEQNTGTNSQTEFTAIPSCLRRHFRGRFMLVSAHKEQTCV